MSGASAQRVFENDENCPHCSHRVSYVLVENRSLQLICLYAPGGLLNLPLLPPLDSSRALPLRWWV